MRTTDERLAVLKNGDISSYCLLCGYVQRSENNKRWKKIYMEHGGFHVMSGPIREGTEGMFDHGQFDTWETFENNELTKARKFYHSLK